MDNVIVYTTNPPCPKCKVLKDKLDKANIAFITVDSKEILLEKGFTHVPMLEIDNKIMNFTQAMNWISERNNNING